VRSDFQQKILHLKIRIRILGWNKELLQDASEIRNLIAQDTNNTDEIVLTITSDRTNGIPAKVISTSIWVKPGGSIYVYEYNEKTGKLYSIYKGYSYCVTEDGKAEITVANSRT